jgi:subtilisin family serine protease
MSLLLACALGFSSLCIDETRVAVFDPSSDSVRLTAKLSTLGVDAVAPCPISGWSIVTAGAQASSATLADRIAASDETLFVSPVFTGATGDVVFATPDLLVQFVRGTSASVEDAVLASMPGFEVVERRFGAMDDAFRLHSHGSDARDVIAAADHLALRRDVVFAEPDCIFTGHAGQMSSTNDPLFPQAWALENTGQSGGVPDVDLDAPEAWDRTQGSPTVIIAIIDTGVESTHPDLVQSMLPGSDFTTDAPGLGEPVNAFDSHGTSVAGCLVAVRNNLVGSCGLAPGCRAISLRTFISVAADGSWMSQVSWTVNALAFAQAVGARVTNNSNGYGFQSLTIAQKYLDLWNADIVNFAAAGNTAGPVDYPASLPGVNAVGSINRTGAHSTFSNTGPELDFVTPGESVITTDRVGLLGWDPSGDYAFVNGTSYSTPLAAGVAALLISVSPGLTSADVEQLLRSSCTDKGTPGPDNTFGFGLVNANEALALACGSPVNFCVTSPNTAGPGAVMGWTGTQSVSSKDLVLIVSGCPPNSTGLVFFGTNPIQIPFGNGFRCVGGMVIRMAPITINGFGDAVQPIDLAHLPQGQHFVAGDQRLFQFWYRNPSAGGAGFNLSDGLRVTFCP